MFIESKLRKPKIIILFILLVAAGVVLILYRINRIPTGVYQTQTIKIASQQIEIYVADTPAKKETGLAAFDQISENQGMIFSFDDATVRTFWMKNMKFAIDIIWIRDDKIIGIDENIELETNKPDNQLTRYSSVEPSDSVIEVNAGWCQRNNIAVGDKISF